MKKHKRNKTADSSMIKFNRVNWRNRLLISTITEGNVRIEWAAARYGQVIPVNWSATGFDLFANVHGNIIGYSIDDAYNILVDHVLKQGSEWLVVIEDDVLLPPDTFVKFGRYMDDGDEPIVSGLYYTKSQPAQPLLFRGRGNGPYHNWRRGQKVLVDGLPMGCILIHTSILRVMADIVENYVTHDGIQLKRVFETPRKVHFDPQIGVQRQEGTQDLYFFDRVMEFEALKKAGWKKAARRKFPFVCDTSIFCQHIDRATGRQYPGAV